jgi:hypothetical protein
MSELANNGAESKDFRRLAIDLEEMALMMEMDQHSEGWNLVAPISHR